jgi:DNA (cytosine-5)-methyltransferase 1
MTTYYNEIDPYAAQWLRNLIAAGHVPAGHVDTRSIEDVTPNDLHGYTQCHFFAGIGVWARALRLAGWADDRPVWTGSCPCQPFSSAGKGAGFDDERHLWPAWNHLIRECRPPVIFGEQVASKDTGPWLDLVHDDLEAMDYAFGAVPFPAAGVGAPHIRDRLYWLADAHDARPQGRRVGWNSPGQLTHRPDSVVGRLAHSEGCGRREECADARRFDAGNRPQRLPAGSFDGGGAVSGAWADADWIPCRDGKWRPVEPGTFPLAHGASARVGRLRAYGNAVVAPAAECFIRAFDAAL